MGLLACSFCALVAVGRMLFLIGWRRPVLAQVLSTDYPERDQDYDRDFRSIACADNQFTTADVPFRSILVRARYEWAGEQYTEDVSVYTYKGDRPDRQEILWIDPANPSKVTSRGIGNAAAWLLGVSIFAFAFWHLPF